MPSNRFPEPKLNAVTRFGIPLKLIVVGVFLSIDRLGMRGALSVSTLALGCDTGAQLLLRTLVKKPSKAS